MYLFSDIHLYSAKIFVFGYKENFTWDTLVCWLQTYYGPFPTQSFVLVAIQCWTDNCISNSESDYPNSFVEERPLLSKLPLKHSTKKEDV